MVEYADTSCDTTSSSSSSRRQPWARARAYLFSYFRFHSLLKLRVATRFVRATRCDLHTICNVLQSPHFNLMCACATVEDSLTSLYDFYFYGATISRSTRTLSHCSSVFTYCFIFVVAFYPNVSNCWHSSIRTLRRLWRNVSCHHRQHPQLHTISSGFQLAFLWSVPHFFFVSLSLPLWCSLSFLFLLHSTFRLALECFLFALFSIIFECVLCSNDVNNLFFFSRKNYTVADFTDRRWKVATMKRNKKAENGATTEIECSQQCNWPLCRLENVFDLDEDRFNEPNARQFQTEKQNRNDANVIAWPAVQFSETVIHFLSPLTGDSQVIFSVCTKWIPKCFTCCVWWNWVPFPSNIICSSSPVNLHLQ